MPSTAFLKNVPYRDRYREKPNVQSNASWNVDHRYRRSLITSRRGMGV